MLPARKSDRYITGLEPLPKWDRPFQSSETIHQGFTNPLDGKVLRVIVEGLTKLLQMHDMAFATSAVVIQQLKAQFANS